MNNYKIVPHKQYIKVLIYAGWGVNDIVTKLNGLDFNEIGDNKMDEIFRECQSVPGGKKMIGENTKRLNKKVPPYVSDDVAETFKYKKMFYDLLCFSIGYATRKTYGHYRPVISLLSKQRQRTFIEIAAMMKMKIADIANGWAKVIKTNKVKNHPKRVIGCYLYYFWRITQRNMDDECADMGDMAGYLSLDKGNLYYFPHRYLAYAEEENLLGFIGIFTDDDRADLNKEVWGKCNAVVLNSLTTREYSVAQWILAEQARLDMKFDEIGSEDGKEYYRGQLGRIFARISGKVRYNLTLDQIKNRNRLERKPEKDQLL